MSEALKILAYALIYSAAYRTHVERSEAGPNSRAADAVAQFKKRCL